MMKKTFFVCFIFLILVVGMSEVDASSTVGARIGDRYFENLEDAITASKSTDTITLTGNAALDETLNINKTVNINLNNFTISSDEKVFLVQGGSLNLSGTGKIKETNPNYGAIMVIGSEDPNKDDFSTISVGSGITLEGWSGVFISQTNGKSYGVLVNMNGKINAVNDKNGDTGIGIYVNGNIKDNVNAPVINLGNDAQINSTGTGIYAAGYATYNINGAYISGVESGIGIKSGIFNILDATIMGTGNDETPTNGNNNGINASGVAIQIESNNGYKGNIEIDIKKGSFKSKNSYVLYEYVVNNTSTKVKDINISGGTFISEADKDVISVSASFKNNHHEFISGGTYSSNPNDFLKPGYSSSLNENSLYVVTSSTAQTFGTNTQGNTFTSILIIVGIIGLALLIWYNRAKILLLFK